MKLSDFMAKHGPGAAHDRAAVSGSDLVKDSRLACPVPADQDGRPWVQLKPDVAAQRHRLAQLQRAEPPEMYHRRLPVCAHVVGPPQRYHEEEGPETLPWRETRKRPGREGALFDRYALATKHRRIDRLDLPGRLPA